MVRIFFSYADLGPLDEDDSDSDEEFRTDGLILEEAEQAGWIKLYMSL